MARVTTVDSNPAGVIRPSGSVENVSQPHNLHVDSMHSPTTQNDLQRARALRDGDETVFTTLVDQYHTRLLRLAIIAVPNRIIAEQRVQETWMDVLRQIGQYDGHTSLKSWVFQMFHAKICSLPEQSGLPLSRVSLTDDRSKDLGGHRETTSPSNPQDGHGRGSPQTPAGSATHHQLIEQALGTLTRFQQQVIILRDMEGFSSNEVCHMLGITEATYRIQLHEARTMVHERLGRSLENELRLA